MKRQVVVKVVALLVLLAISIEPSAVAQITANISQNSNMRFSGVADFDGDGKQDLVAIPHPDQSIQIWLSNGDGTFRFPAPISFKTLAIFSAAPGDFDGDGKQDLVAVALFALSPPVPDREIVFLKGAGDGTFGAPVMTPTTCQPACPSSQVPPAVGDFDGDGILDMVFVTGQFFHGNGDGTFTHTQNVTDLIETGFSVGDFNKDGKLDLVNGGRLLLGNGDGTFSPHPNVGSIDLGVFADVNGDGNLDVVFGSPQAVVFLGDGQGGVQQTFHLEPNWDAYVVPAVADFDGDGVPDILLLPQGPPDHTSMFYRGNGDGTFQVGVTFNVGVGYLLGAPYIAFLDSSAQPSIVTGQGDIISPFVGTVGLQFEDGAEFFGAQAVNTISASRYVYVTNVGTSAATLPAMLDWSSTDFSVVDSCPISLAAGESCALSINFIPTSAGLSVSHFALTSGASRAPLAIELVGTGVVPSLTTTQTSLTFGSQQVGTISPPQSFTITNNGSKDVMPNFQVQGDFTFSTTCLASTAGPAFIAAGKSCSVKVWFAPLNTGQENGSMLITDDIGDQISISLTGTGFVTGPLLTVTPASIDFGQQFAGTSSAPQTVTLTNSGDAPVSLSSFEIAIQAGRANDFSILNNCGATLAPSISCGIGVFYDPAQPATSTGTLTISSNAPGSPNVVSLNGNGTSITIGIAAGSSPAQTVTAGQTATYALSVAPVNSFTGHINFSCSGIPSGWQCAVTPAAVTLNGPSAVPVSVAITTSATAGTHAMKHAWGGWLSLPLSTFAFLGLLAGRKRRLVRVGLTMVLLCALVVLWTSCGGGSTITAPSAQNNRTFIVTVAGNASSTAKVETQLTLTVN